MSILRRALLPALVAASLALPAAAEDAHHPPADAARPPAQPGGMMMGNMMQMMQRMMAGMHDRGAMQRLRMMGMGGTGMMDTMGRMQARGPAVTRVEGHIAWRQRFGVNVRLDGQQLEALVAGLERHRVGIARGGDDGEHLAAHLEHALAAPLDRFGGARQGKAKPANRRRSHGPRRGGSWSTSGESASISRRISPSMAAASTSRASPLAASARVALPTAPAALRSCTCQPKLAMRP